ncbi:MAG: hypothetical protein GY845_23780 [Planctomycetes bacterium]|nr:hypothetical protein [Planctomycetota bacterium]
MEPFKVLYHWRNVDWAAQYLADDPAGTRRATEAVADRMLEVAKREDFKHVTDALDAFLRRFYPDEGLEHKWQIMDRCKRLADENLAKIPRVHGCRKKIVDALIRVDPVHQALIPWHGHSRNEDFYTEMKRKLPWLDIGKMCRDSLVDKLADSWLLSWHWRAIIPYIRYWNKAATNQTLLIQQCQVRQWELLLCYEFNTDVDLDRCRCRDLSGDLVRAPIVGRSHRMRRWDVYRLFFAPTVPERIIEAASYAARNNANDPMSLAYVLGRHDFIYHIQNIKKNDDPLGLQIEGGFRIDLQPEEFVLGQDDIGCDGSPFLNPRDLVTVPAFGNHKKMSILLASDNYCMAVEQLSEVLNDPTAKSALIIAPPGSGKERLAQMAYVCRCRIRNKPKGPFVATTLAGMDVGEAQKTLFSLEDVLPGYDPTTREITDIPDAARSVCGLVFQSLGGSLFLDEIDKMEEAVLAMLLRFLESQEILIPGRNTIVRLRDDQVPLYVFAGSINRRDMFERKPVDFWTRVSHVVEMSHPLAVGDASEIRRVVSEYIRMFWISHAKKFLDLSGHMGTDGDFNDPDLIKQCPAIQDLYKPIVYPVFSQLRRCLVSSQIVEFVCDVIGDELVGHGQALPSVRRIRSIVGRSMFGAVELFMHSKEYGSAIEELKGTNKDHTQTPADWFSTLCHHIDSRRQLVTGPGLDPRAVNNALCGLKLAEQFESALRRSAVFSS